MAYKIHFRDETITYDLPTPEIARIFSEVFRINIQYIEYHFDVHESFTFYIQSNFLKFKEVADEATIKASLKKELEK